MELQGKQSHQQNTHLDLARFQNLSHGELMLRMSVRGTCLRFAFMHTVDTDVFTIIVEIHLQLIRPVSVY